MFKNAYSTNVILGNLCESQEHCVYVLSIFYFLMETLAAFLIGFAIHAGIDLITGPSRQKRRTQARHQGDLLNPEV
ncbi:MAG: hypothetical protein K2X93_28320 [Candidatus Obscuribacterales bacterium]|nr:hypothetical protein [Candidatus Obscuribacterales bacterium]